jgi:cobalt-zinc-cadmium efflux system protein
MSFNCNHNHVLIKNLFWAIVINLLLTVVQIVAGVLSGSLSLIADAIHNLSDASSLIIAYVAEKISHKPADSKMNYGYGRAQIIGAFVNSLTLIFVGLYIIYEVVLRFLDPKPIDGWMVIVVASIALIIDLLTAKLTHHGSKHNINMKAAFIHNLSDAMASVVVIISGVLVLLYDFYIFDLVASLLISAFILYQSIDLIKDCTKYLMQSVPDDLNYDEIKKTILDIEQIKEIKSLYIWSMNDTQRSLQAQIITSGSTENNPNLLMTIKDLILEKFKIQDSTIELINQ